MIESLVTWRSQVKHNINPISELMVEYIRMLMWKGSKFWKKRICLIWQQIYSISTFLRNYLLITMKIMELWQTLKLPPTLTSKIEFMLESKWMFVTNPKKFPQTVPEITHWDRRTTWKHNAVGQNCRRCRGVKSCDKPNQPQAACFTTEQCRDPSQLIAHNICSTVARLRQCWDQTEAAGPTIQSHSSALSPAALHTLNRAHSVHQSKPEDNSSLQNN